MFKRSLLILSFCAVSAQGALTITFKYDYDTTGFFKNHPERQALLEAAARVFTTNLPNSGFTPVVPSGINHWSLFLNNPSTGAPLQLDDPIATANTLVIYPGARTLTNGVLGRAQSAGYSAFGTNEWLDLLDSKDSTKNYQPLGFGVISFEADEARWYFDLDPTTDDSGSYPGRFDFYSVAQHEIAHLLGFSAGSLAFRTNSSGANFVGPNATATFGGPVALSEDRSHLAASLLPFQGKVLGLRPRLADNSRANMSIVEFSVLRDIGYDTLPPVVVGPPPPPPPTIKPLVIGVANGDNTRGDVTEAFRGTTQREIGKNYIVAAVPKPGFEFAGWTGGISSFENPLSFVMEEGLSLTANFRQLFFPGWDGQYFGIFKGNVPRGAATAWLATNGTWQITVKNAVFTGKVVINGRTTPFKGVLVDAGGPNGGTWTLPSVKTGLPVPFDSVKLTIHNDPQSGAMTGTLEVNGFQSSLATRKIPPYNAISPAPYAGAYTVALPRESVMSSPTPPQGTGYGLMTVAATGATRIVGKFADGAAFTLTAPLNEDKKLDFSSQVLGKLGYVTASMAFTGPVNDPVIESTMRRSRLPSAALPKTAWSGGFDTNLLPQVNRWDKPVVGQPGLGAFNSPNNLTVVEVGQRAPYLCRPVVTPPAGGAETLTALQTDAPFSLKLKLTGASGLVTGTFLDKSVTPVLTRAFTGVLLKKAGVAAGFYLGKSPDPSNTAVMIQSSDMFKVSTQAVP